MGALVEVLTPLPRVKMGASIGADPYARISPSVSTTAGVRDGRRGAALSALAATALVEPNPKTDVGDCPSASTPVA